MKLGSVRECKGMHPHTPKWTPTLEVRISMDFQTFRGQLQVSKLITLKSLLYHWKVLETWMYEMGSHDPFVYLKHKLWPKEGPRVKLLIWFLTTKSQKLPWFFFVQVACHIPLESSRQRLQLCFRPYLNRKSSHKIMGPQSCRSPNLGNFGIPTCESQDKTTIRC